MKVHIMTKRSHNSLLTIISSDTPDGHFPRCEPARRIRDNRDTRRAMFTLLSHRPQLSGRKNFRMRATMGMRLGPGRVTARQNVWSFNPWAETAFEVWRP